MGDHDGREREFYKRQNIVQQTIISLLIKTVRTRKLNSSYVLQNRVS